MRTLLIVFDNSPEARHASQFALNLAQKIKANILLANTIKISKKKVEKAVAWDVTKENPVTDHDHQEQSIQEVLAHLKSLNEGPDNFNPEIEELDISNMDENQVAQLVIKNHIWMIVKGTEDVLQTSPSKNGLDVHTVLNHVLCPLLLVPVSWQIKNIERLVYIADLRYCRIQVVRYLADLAKSWSADLSIAHLSAKGLPDMAEKYALSVFSEEVMPNVNYDRLFFNNINEKDLIKVVDVIINGMHNDLLVLVNHRFHFEKLKSRYLTDAVPLNITIPLLIFPY